MGKWQIRVDIFFVISGFVMTISTKQTDQHPARSFLTRRLIRIAPMYWLLTIVTLLKLFLGHVWISLQNVGAHVMLTPGYIV